MSNLIEATGYVADATSLEVGAIIVRTVCITLLTLIAAVSIAAVIAGFGGRH
jgi:hypothetical protein